MLAPDRRSRLAFAACLLACGVGWCVLPYAPWPMPGEPFPGALPVLQHLFAWWPLGLPVAFAIAVALQRVSVGSVALRGLLRVAQWLLTMASIALVCVALFEVLSPRPY